MIYRKKTYETVEAEVTLLSPADVITTSSAAFNGKDDEFA